MNRRRAVVGALALTLAAAAVQAAFVWTEGEGVFKTNIPNNPWMKGDDPKLLSAGDAFGGLIEHAKDRPDPCFLVYKVEIPENGDYFMYLRQGYRDHGGKTRFRFVKVGDDDQPLVPPGADEGWTELDLNSPVSDQVAIGEFRTVEWVQYPRVALEKGKYLLTFEVLGPNPTSTEADPPIWCMLDVLCLTTEPFTPRGDAKPGAAAAAGATNAPAPAADRL